MDILKIAAQDDRVNKIFVNAAIKVWMCKTQDQRIDPGL